MSRKGVVLRVTLHALGEQLRREALTFGDAFDLDRDRVHGLLEVSQSIVVYPSPTAFGAQQSHARGDADADEGADGEDDAGADGEKGVHVWIHGSSKGGC